MATDNPATGTGSGGADTGGLGSATSAFANLLSGEPAKREPKREAESSTSVSDDLVDDLPEGETGHDEERSGESSGEGAPAQVDESDDHDEIPEDLRKFRLKTKIGEKVEALTLEELQKGYQRQSDYTRKTQEVAQHRAGVENNLQFLAQQRQQVDQVLGVASQLLQAQMPQEPDWNGLAQDPDPRVMILARANWERHQTKLNQFQTAQAANREAWSYEQNQLLQNRMNSEVERLVEKMPALKDPAKRSEARARFSTYAMAQGFTPQELSGVTDHRMLLVLDDAAKYRELVERAKTRKTGMAPSEARPAPTPIRTATPGARSTQTRSMTKAAENFKRLAKSGSLRDAQAVFGDLL